MYGIKQSILLALVLLTIVNVLTYLSRNRKIDCDSSAAELLNECRAILGEKKDCNNDRMLKAWMSEFKKLGKKHGINKVSPNNYHHLYGLYMGAKHKESISMLILGLNCNSTKGSSLSNWRDYLPNAHIIVLEQDKECAKSFLKKIDRVYIAGDEEPNLETKIKKIGKTGPYDIVIDDGSYTRSEQLSSLVTIWPNLKTGGIYVIEDNDNNHLELASQGKFSFNFGLKFLQATSDQTRSTIVNLDSIYDQLFSINCFLNVCLFVKK